MFDIIGESLFAALRDAAMERLGRDHVCFEALDRAANEAGPAARDAAQTALAALDPEIAAALLADAHKALREDSRALLGGWQSGGKAH